jgi:3-phenylpropionate/cinnamic acid dioxygenase small subunit
MTAKTVDRDVRQDVSEVLVRYATGIDRRDWPLLQSCFTEDCDADYGDIGAWHGAEAIAKFMEQSHTHCGHTLHRITNHAIVPTADGVDARSYVDAIVMAPDNKTGVRAVGYYDDGLVRTADGWKIARRRFTMVLLQTNLAAGGTP